MAKYPIIQIRGEFEGVIFYLRGGKYFMRRKPAKVKQSKPTKRNSGKFGTANKMSKEIRRSLQNFLPDKKSRGTMYLLNDAIYQWLRLEPNLKEKGIQPAARLRETSLNGNYGFTAKRHINCRVNWKNEGEVVITLPAMVTAKKIEAPAKTESITLQLAVISCQVKNPMITDKQFTSVELPYTKDELATQEISIPVEKLPGTLILVAASLQYHLKNDRPINSKDPLQWLPAGIVDAVYVG